MKLDAPAGFYCFTLIYGLAYGQYSVTFGTVPMATAMYEKFWLKYATLIIFTILILLLLIILR